MEEEKKERVEGTYDFTYPSQAAKNELESESSTKVYTQMAETSTNKRLVYTKEQVGHCLNISSRRDADIDPRSRISERDSKSAYLFANGQSWLSRLAYSVIV